MRWYVLDGGEMLALWASLSGIIYLLIGFMLGGSAKAIKQGALTQLNFLILVPCQISNTTFFVFAIGIASIAIVLVAVARVPIISVILRFVFTGEHPSAGPGR